MLNFQQSISHFREKKIIYDHSKVLYLTPGIYYVKVGSVTRVLVIKIQQFYDSESEKVYNDAQFSNLEQPMIFHFWKRPWAISGD